MGDSKGSNQNLFNFPIDDDKFVDVPTGGKFEDIHFEKYEFVNITFKIKLKDSNRHHEIDDNIIIANEIRAINEAKFKSLQVHEINEINYKEKYYELVNQIKKIIEE